MRLANLGWFMKSLKEPLARIANKEEGVSGAFWEGRYKSVGIFDEESLLATAAYIDLNPLAAGVVATPEESTHTSLGTRINHSRPTGQWKRCVTTSQFSRKSSAGSGALAAAY